MITNKDSITAEDLMYPKSKPFHTGYLDVGHGHQIYYQQSGNPQGPVVLLVHGGPGSGIEEGARMTRLHNPKYFHVIAVDQRGCGQSKPHFADDRKHALAHNTPDKLVADFEMLRAHLGVQNWHVFGYSWGSCLAAYYAAHHPTATTSLTIGGIWMHTQSEIDWYINRMGLFFPEAEATLLEHLPKTTKRFDRLNVLYKAIIGTDQKRALTIAAAQGNFEGVAVHFESAQQQAETTPKKTPAQKKLEQRKMISVGALEIFYMKANPLPANWYKTPAVIKALKTIHDFAIIQGRFDIVCPPTTAYELHKTYLQSTLTMVHYAGHATSEIQMLQALLKANARLQ